MGRFSNVTNYPVVYVTVTNVNLTSLGVADLDDLSWIECRLVETLVPLPGHTQAVESWTPVKLVEQFTDRAEDRWLTLREGDYCHFEFSLMFTLLGSSSRSQVWYR